MDEQTSPPFVNWDYELIDGDGDVVELGSRLRRRKGEGALAPGTGWHIEFRGRTLCDEIILARYHPADDQDAREWLTAFESGSLGRVPVSIDAYFGPTEEPEEPLDESDDSDEPEDDPDETEDDSAHPGADLVDVEHTIHIGHGLAKWHENELIITIPPEVFRDAVETLVRGYRSKYEYIEQRVFDIFWNLSPKGCSEFWDGFYRSAYPNDVFSFDDECREACWRGRPIRFDRPADYDCLRLLDSASGEVITYTKLTQALRPNGVSDKILQFKAPLELKTCISHLRSSLKAVDCSCGISNIRGFGYRLSPSR